MLGGIIFAGGAMIGAAAGAFLGAAAMWRFLRAPWAARDIEEATARRVLREALVRIRNRTTTGSDIDTIAFHALRVTTVQGGNYD